jgi:MFS family permease
MAGLVAARCVLGVLEAGFGAGAPYYLSLFYQRKELGLRVALLTGMSPLANCFAASLAYGITHIKGSLEPWRLLFLIGKLRLPLIIKPVLTVLRGCSDHSICSCGLLFPSRFPKHS